MISPEKVLCIVYSPGGIGDVGRHAVRAALDQWKGTVRVLTKSPATLLDDPNWNCSCENPHIFSDADIKRLEVVSIDVSKEEISSQHMANVGTVVSALGNRQPFYGHREGAPGTLNLIRAMEASNIDRVVAVTSVGCNEDWPPVEFHWVGGILTWLFRTVVRDGYRDLSGAETALKQSKLNYLLVRPMGLGETQKNKGEYFIQKEKGKDKVAPVISKMDCATFVVKEALEPSYQKTAVVIGGDWENFELDPPKNKE